MQCTNRSMTQRVLQVLCIGITGAALFSACADTELRPAFTSIEGLPATLEEPETPLGFSFAVRNVGEGRVSIQSVTFADDPDENFFDVQTDLDELLSTEQMVVAFSYKTPGGNAQTATLVIESDATQNPTLEVPVETREWIAFQPPDAGPGGDDAGNAGTDDAGNPGNDAGNPGNDAGNPGNDAGNASTADAGDAGQ